MMIAIKNNIKSNLYDYIAIVTIILCGFIFLNKFSNTTDIGLYDESNYLAWGLDIFKVAQPAENGVGYMLWYYFISLFQPDRVKLYYLNIIILTIALPLSIFIVLRRYYVPLIIAFLIATLFLVSNANFPLSPKVSQFAAIVMLLGIAAATCTQDTRLKMYIFASVALIISYARPDFFISYIIFIMILIINSLITLRKDIFSKGTLLLSVFLIINLVVVWILGLPISKDGTRSLLAFGQHFSANYVVWNGINENPWTNWNKYFNQSFKGSTSILSAAFANPSDFFRHILSNLKLFPLQIEIMGKLIYPKYIFDLGVYQLKILLWTSAFFVVVQLLISKSNVLNYLKTCFYFDIKSKYVDVIYLLIFLIPPAITVVLIYPREHYLLFIILLIIILISLLLFRQNKLISIKFNTNIAFILICIFSLFAIRPVSQSISDPLIANRKVIAFLSTLNIKENINILEAEGGYSIYLGDNFKRIPEYAKGEPFDLFMSKNNINMIVISNALRADSRFKSDSKWTDFISSPNSFGFELLNIPGLDDRLLLVRREVLKK